jgi:hypothetical protein
VKAHVTIDEAKRLAYVELLPNEKNAANVDFLLQAVSWFDAQGITCRVAISAMAFSLGFSSLLRAVIARWCWARSFSSYFCSFKVSTDFSLASWAA